MSKIRSIIRPLVCPILALFEPPLMKKARWGDDFPDKTFLIIRRNEPQAGICSLMLSVLAWVRFAEQNNMVPVVDMQTPRSMYLKLGERGRINAWETFFAQPGGYTLEEIAHARRIIIATGIMPLRGFMPGFTSELNTWRRLANRVLHSVDVLSAKIPEREHLIGVLARGTDYLSLRPKGHPVQPTAQQLIAKIRETDEQAWVYLVTEDASIQAAFQHEFKGRLVVANQDCIDYKSGYLADNCQVKGDRGRAVAYLRALYGLAQCSCVIAGKTSGSLIAALLASENQRAYYFDLGTY